MRYWNLEGRKSSLIPTKSNAIPYLDNKRVPSFIEDLKKKLIEEEVATEQWLDQSFKVNPNYYMDLHSKISKATMKKLLKVVISSDALVNGLKHANRTLSEELGMTDVEIGSEEVIRLTLTSVRVRVINLILDSLQISEDNKRLMVNRFIEKLMPIQSQQSKPVDFFSQFRRELARINQGNNHG